MESTDYSVGFNAELRISWVGKMDIERGADELVSDDVASARLSFRWLVFQMLSVVKLEPRLGIARLQHQSQHKVNGPQQRPLHQGHRARIIHEVKLIFQAVDRADLRLVAAWDRGSNEYEETWRNPPRAGHGLFISSGGESMLCEDFLVGQPGLVAWPNVGAPPLASSWGCWCAPLAGEVSEGVALSGR